jgi:hypothetical protein
MFSLQKKKSNHLQQRLNNPAKMEIQTYFSEIEISIHIGCLYQRIQSLLRICSYLATLIPLVTNACIFVAFHPCNAQKRNTFLSVGKVASNAYINT